MKKILKTTMVAVGAALMLTLAACAAPAADTGPQAQDGAATPAPQDAAPAALRDSITIGLPADISNLDPQHTASASDFRMFELIFSSLLRNSEIGFVPSIATGYTISDDGMSYIFTIREGVTFHDGTPLTVGDVVFTFHRAMESPFVGGPLASIADVVAISDNEVRFDLHYPFAPFIAAIAGIWIVSESIINEMGEAFSANPIGTGPYRFIEHQPGRSIELTRFDDYFGGPAPIRDVTYMVILSHATASIAVEAGDIDFTIGIPPGDVPRLDAMDNLTATFYDTNSLAFLTMNTQLPPFDNPLVRQAIAHAVDREGVILMVAEGLGSPANSFLNELSFGYDPTVQPFPRDVARGRELMAEAGFPNGFTATLTTIGDGAVFEGLATVMQSNLAEIGITVSIELQDQAVFIGNLFGLNYELGVLAMALPGADANAWDAVLTTDGGMNMTGYSDPEIDEWFRQGRMTVDAAERLAIYRQVAERVNETAAFIPIYFFTNAFIHNADLEMGFIGPTGNFRVDAIRWVN